MMVKVYVKLAPTSTGSALSTLTIFRSAPATVGVGVFVGVSVGVLVGVEVGVFVACVYSFGCMVIFERAYYTVNVNGCFSGFGWGDISR